MTREFVDNHFEVERGTYRVLILFANNDMTVERIRANEEGAEYGTSEIPPDGELDRLDRYHIHFWPVAPLGTRLIKRRKTRIGGEPRSRHAAGLRNTKFI